MPRPQQRRFARRPLAAATAALLAAGLVPPAAVAQLYPATWVGGTGNWLVERPGAWAFVDFTSPWKFFPDNSGSTYFAPFIPGGHVTLNEGVVPGPTGVPTPFLGITVSTLALGTGGELTIKDSGSLTVNGVAGVGSLLTNQGLITLKDSASLSAPFAMPVLGAGEISMRGTNTFFGGLGIITHDSAHTISGFGTIAVGTLLNQGTVIADAPGEALRFTGGYLDNGGTLRAGGRTPGEPGGELRIKPLAGMKNSGQAIAEAGFLKVESTSLDNGGLFEARALGTVVLQDVNVDNGGTLRVLAGGAFALNGSNTIKGGTLDAAPGTRFSVGSGTTEITGNVALQGAMKAEGGTLKFNNANVTMPSGLVELIAGTVATAQGSGNTFTGGTWKGPGQLNATAPTTWNGSPQITLDGVRIDLFTQVHRFKGEFANAGTINLRNTAFNGNLRMLLDGNTRFSGTGALVFAQGAGNQVTQIEAASSGYVLTNAGGHTIRSAPGAQGLVLADLVNESVVDAGGGTVSIRSARVENRGALRASAGELRFDAGAPTIVENALGRIDAAPGATVTFANSVNAAIRGGTLGAAGTLRNLGVLTLDGATSGPLATEAGTTITNANATVYGYGEIVNDGRLVISDGTSWLSGPVRLWITDTVRFGGAGVLELRGSGESEIAKANAAALLALGPQQRLTVGANSAGTLRPDVLNEGRIDATGANAVLNAALLNLANRGLVTAGADGTVRLEPSGGALVIDNAGGRIAPEAGGTVLFGNGVTVRGGTLGGAGTLRRAGTTTLEGPIAIEAGTTFTSGRGTLYATGTVTNDGRLLIEDTESWLAGPSQLLVSGPVRFDGAGVVEMRGNSETLIAAAGGAGDRLVLGAAQSLRVVADTSATLSANTRNEGVVEARGANATLLGRLGSFENAGVLRAAEGGTFHFIGPNGGGGVIDNAAGRIEAAAGGSVWFGDGHPAAPFVTLRGGALGGPGTLRNTGKTVLDGATSGPIAVEAGATFSTRGGTVILAGTLANHGTVQLEDVTSWLGGAVQLLVRDTATVVGAGTIEMRGHSETLIAPESAGARLVLDAGQTLRAVADTSAALSVDTLNRGTIEARGTNATLLGRLGSFENAGVLRAAEGGTFHFIGPNGGGGLIDNAAGRIEAAAGGSVWFGDGHPAAPFVTLRGGVLGGPGLLRNSGKTLLDGATLGPITVEAGATFESQGGTVIVAGNVVNQGKVLLQDNTSWLGGATQVLVRGTTTFSGTGTIEMRNNSETLIAPESAASRLVLEPGQTLKVASATSATVSTPFENRGRIATDGANASLLISGRDVRNVAEIAVGADGRLEFSGTTAAGMDVDNAGGTIAAGDRAQVWIGNGHPLAPTTRIHGGRLTGTGTFYMAHAVLADGVVIAPGASPGTLNFSGALALDPLGALEIEIAGTTPGVLFDRVIVSGAATLDGDLDVHLLGGFAPGQGDVFRILTAASVSGSFDNVAGGKVTFADGVFDVRVGANYVDLANFSPVPEPGTWAMLAAGLGALLWRRRRQNDTQDTSSTRSTDSCMNRVR